MQCEGNSNLRPILWVGKKLTYSLHQPFYIWKKIQKYYFLNVNHLDQLTFSIYRTKYAFALSNI